jgi:hypothetical protein
MLGTANIIRQARLFNAHAEDDQAAALPLVIAVHPLVQYIEIRSDPRYRVEAVASALSKAMSAHELI